ncbi:serine peptidase [Streptomyces sp. enrichment culture]|uniref:serine peptidase n=1 Tax=Streptomyces sp. enrichment culture TaxID=1795815 RepID=UPI003F545C20
MIVGVHGIRCYRYLAEAGTVEGAAEALAAEWAAALGMPLSTAYYAPLLHLGAHQGTADAPELLPPGAQRMLTDWVSALGAPAEVTMGPGTLPVRQAASWLAERFGEVARKVAIVFCREADTYVTDRDSPRRAAARDEVLRVLHGTRPRAVVAHSLGSVVAYEALWHRPVALDLLVTLGSPLGMPHVVFERLALGEGNEERKGERPPGVRRWVNVADVGDIVAIPRDLPSRFPGIDDHHEVSLGLVASHKATRYLARPEVVDALAPLLAAPDGA